MTLSLFEPKTKSEKLDPQFEPLLQSDIDLFQNYRKILTDWTNGFIDLDHNFVNRFRHDHGFFNAFWELYLHRVFYNQSSNWKLEQKHNVPDLILKNDNQQVLIEAVTANASKSRHMHFKQTYPIRLADSLNTFRNIYMTDNFKIGDIISNPNVFDRTDIRYTSAINTKIKKYKSYQQKTWVNKSNPYIIALNDRSDECSGQHGLYSLLETLYGLAYQITYHTGAERFVEKKYAKKNNNKIPIGYFTSAKHAEISGILFATQCATTGKLDSLIASQIDPFTQLYYHTEMDTRMYSYSPILLSKHSNYGYINASTAYPAYMTDGLIYLSNPYAKNPIDPSFFEDFNIPTLTWLNKTNQLIYTLAHNDNHTMRPFMLTHFSYPSVLLKNIMQVIDMNCQIYPNYIIDNTELIANLNS